ncbi:hypothetical protein A2U01_0062233, partial [Trifolium medium]|nr:hypothetical protein [Trifolium medium]
AASAPMTRKEMIASLEANCKELDEKKMLFERMIHALRLEEAVVEVENAVVDEGQADNAGDDDMEADSKAEDEDSDTSGSTSV